MDKIEIEFKDRLREIRGVRKLTQADLAAKAELPATSVSHLEAGSRKPSFDNLRKLAKALDVSTDFLLGRTQSIEENAPDTLYRDLQNLSDANREMIKNLVETLRNQNKPKE